MYNYARKLCRNSAEAEDLTQQALIKSYTYSQNHQIDPNKIKSFLITTVRNTFLDSIRSKKHQEINCSETFDNFTESYIESIKDSFNYDSVINSIDTNRNILPVLEKLKKYPELHQSLDYFIRDYTYEEIAKLMKTNIGSVKSRLYRARKFVQENISEEFLANI
jgi:RNA polymerase sigma-70 factor (ECF subfamily)